jgi:hypothetical protein
VSETFFTKSGSSPGSDQPDFVCEFHISLFRLHPLSPAEPLRHHAASSSWENGGVRGR